MNTNKIAKPRKIVVPISEDLAWENDGEHIYEQKMDGVFAVREVRGENFQVSIIAGEQMRSGEFHAFDCPQFNCEDIRALPLRERLKMLNTLFLSHSNAYIIPPHFRIVPALNYQPSTLNEIWQRGGEGIVRKRLDAPWGTPMECCKRLETFHCIVTARGNGQSVEIADSTTMQPRGNVKLGGGKCDRVRVGSILKIEGFGLTSAGMIREPRPDKDGPNSFLVRY